MNKLKSYTSIVFNVLTLLFLGMIAYLVLWNKSMADNRGWILVAAAALCAIIANFDKIDNFKLSTSGIEAKMKEVDNKISDLQKLAETMSVFFINMMYSEGKLGGHDPYDIEEQKKKLEMLLSDLGISEERRKQIMQTDKKDVQSLYLYGIIRMIQKSEKSTSEQKAQANSMLEHFSTYNNQEPYKNTLVFKTMGITDPDILELIEDYTFYTEKDQHRRMDVWLKRQSWFD